MSLPGGKVETEECLSLTEGRVGKVWTKTPEKWRSRGDLIEAYKIITGKEAIQWDRFFELAPTKVTRRHRYK